MQRLEAAAAYYETEYQAGSSSVRVDHVMESRDVMNIHVVEHSILNGIEYCTFWFRSVVEMTRHQLLLQAATDQPTTPRYGRRYLQPWPERV
jgi:hypothetical protein